MTDSKFQPGVLVRDNHARVGKIVGNSTLVELDGNPVEVFSVDFWGNEVKRPNNWLTLLAPESPEALLLERPETLASWADEAPLKLVALALSVGGGEGKMADIRAKLDGRVLEAGKWENWWKKQQQQMRKLPACFKIVKTGRDIEYNLLIWYDSVPAATELKAVGAARKEGATPADWKVWLEATTHGPPPGRFPTRQFASSLARWHAEAIEPALLRLITSVEELSSSREPSAQAAEGWLRAVAQAALRWREVGGSDPRGYTAARVGEALARLARIAGDRTPYDLLLQAGAMDGEADAWRRGFLAGMWESFEGEEARDMYLGSASLLGRQARGDLARQITLAAFGPEIPERRYGELDRLLDALPESDRGPLLEEVMARAVSAQRAEVRDYLADSRHFSGAGQLGIRLKGVLTVSNPHDEFTARTSRELADALASPERLPPEIKALFGEAAKGIDKAKSSFREEVQNRSAEAQSKIEVGRQEQERLRQQVRERNAELAANREESRLEVRRDMLLAVGEVLQSVSRSRDSGALAGDVEAGLTLALRAGGAEPLETPGEIVAFDPELHDTEGNVPARGAVRVIAPGVVYRGGTHGESVLLKAQVKHEAG